MGWKTYIRVDGEIELDPNLALNAMEEVHSSQMNNEIVRCHIADIQLFCEICRAAKKDGRLVFVGIYH